MDSPSVLSIVVAGISLVISLFVALRNWRYSETGVRYTSRNQYMNALFDINRQLANRPELWAIYDDHPVALQRSNETLEKARRQAFIYFHFNLFETVFHDYTHVLRPNRTDALYWESWQRWIASFLGSSREARDLFREKICQDTYMNAFVHFMNGMINNVETGALKPTPIGTLAMKTLPDSAGSARPTVRPE
ncbi:MAG TPA: hypothetical protein VES88_10030 [Gemmatimonadaceae bacterium]|nr:hypothetical protein [Gemmatimonadaceae bacterium]